MDWVRLGALVDEWPESYDDIDCSLLDPSDEDDRNIGLDAAHTDLDGDVDPRLHLAAHRIVARQLILDDPPEARATAERLIARGYDYHDVLHMIGFAVLHHIDDALAIDQPIDRVAYTEALDALPQSWHDTESGLHYLDDDYGRRFAPLRKDIESQLRKRRSIEPKLLAERLGLDDIDPRELSLYVRWHEDFAHVLPDGRIAHVVRTLDGVVLLHQLTDAERAAERLDLNDLVLVFSIARGSHGMRLGAGGRAEITHRMRLDGPRPGPDDEAPGVMVLEGSPGWLAHVGDAKVIALSWQKGVLSIERSAVDDVAAARAASALADGFAAQSEGDPELIRFDGGACELDELLLDVLVDQPDALRCATAPIDDLVRDAGLSRRGDLVAFDNYDWDAHDERHQARVTHLAVQDAGVDPDDQVLVHRVIDRVSAWIDGKRADRTALVQTGHELLVPGAVAAVYDAIGRHARREEVKDVLVVAERIVDAQNGRADSGARFLAALCADRIGDGTRADAHVRAAMQGELDDLELFELAMRYAFVKGDLTRAARLFDLADLDVDEPELAAVLRPFLADADRNEPCPCGSGRKHKWCHGRESGPPVSAEEQAELVHRKAALVASHAWGLAVSRALRRLGWDIEGEDDPTPEQRAIAADLVLFEGGCLPLLRQRWGPLFPTDEQSALAAWTGARLAVVDGYLTRALPAESTTWQPWALPLPKKTNTHALLNALADADYTAAADTLAPLLAHQRG